MPTARTLEVQKPQAKSGWRWFKFGDPDPNKKERQKAFQEVKESNRQRKNTKGAFGSPERF